MQGRLWAAIAEGDERNQKQLFDSYEPNIHLLHRTNESHYGIFRTVNSFYGFKRVETRLASFNYFFIDADCPKSERHKKENIENYKRNFELKIYDSGIKVTELNETKNGYQFKIRIKEEDRFVTQEKIEDYKNIQRHLISYFKGDIQCSDVSRLLREPGFFHYKNIKDPFLITDIVCPDIVDPNYEVTFEFMENIFFKVTDSDILSLFEDKKEIEDSEYKEDNIFSRSEKWDVEKSLKILEGTEFLNCPVSFKRNGNGTTQVCFKGKTSGLFFVPGEKSRLKYWLHGYHENWGVVARALTYIESKL